MKALLYKDFCLSKKTLKMYLLMYAVYGGIAVISPTSGSFFSGFCMVLAGMLPMTTFAYDEQNHWGRFGLALPFSRGLMVGEKYVLGLIALLAALPMCLVIGLISGLRGGLDFAGALAQCGQSALMWSAMGLIFGSLTTPLLIAFGAEKGRLAFIGSFVVLGVLVGALDPDVVGMLEIDFTLLLGGLLAVALIAYAISCRISLTLYKRKEFG